MSIFCNAASATSYPPTRGLTDRRLPGLLARLGLELVRLEEDPPARVGLLEVGAAVDHAHGVEAEQPVGPATPDDEVADSHCRSGAAVPLFPRQPSALPGACTIP